MVSEVGLQITVSIRRSRVRMYGFEDINIGKLNFPYGKSMHKYDLFPLPIIFLCRWLIQEHLWTCTPFTWHCRPQ